VHRSRSVLVRSLHHACLATALCACQARAPRPDVVGDIVVATGVAGAVALDVDPVTAAPARLELGAALERALDSDAELRAALARVRIALADADQTRLLPNPVLALVLRFPEGGGRIDVEAGVGTELLELFQRPRRIRAADRRLHASVAEAVAAALDVVAALRARYAAVQALDELVPLLAERARLLGELTRAARGRLQAGEASRLDVLALEARGAELRLEIAAREAERRQERLALASSIGTAEDAAVWELEAWSEVPQVPGELGDEDAWTRAALRHRPELAAVRWELAALGEDVALVSPWSGAELALEAERDGGTWAAGPAVAVPLPLFDSGRVRRERAEAAVLAARAELEGAARRVVTEVRRAHAEVRSALERLALVESELVPLQRERRAQVEAVYLAGEGDVTSLLLAEQDLQETQAQLVGLRREVALALARLERAVGGAGALSSLGDDADDDADGEAGGAR
jgi:cobalt-zinc-cadmium efflux system outer membrane protein